MKRETVAKSASVSSPIETKPVARGQRFVDLLDDYVYYRLRAVQEESYYDCNSERSNTRKELVALIDELSAE